MGLDMYVDKKNRKTGESENLIYWRKANQNPRLVRRYVYGWC